MGAQERPTTEAARTVIPKTKSKSTIAKKPVKASKAVAKTTVETKKKAVKKVVKAPAKKAKKPVQKKKAAPAVPQPPPTPAEIEAMKAELESVKAETAREKANNDMIIENTQIKQDEHVNDVRVFRDPQGKAANIQLAEELKELNSQISKIQDSIQEHKSIQTKKDLIETIKTRTESLQGPVADNGPFPWQLCETCQLPYERNVEDRCPKVLDCGHTFCFGCIKSMVHKNTITCPFDGNVTEPKGKGAVTAKLTKNFSVLNMCGF